MILHNRPKKLSGDKTKTEDAVLHYLKLSEKKKIIYPSKGESVTVTKEQSNSGITNQNKKRLTLAVYSIVDSQI